MSTLETSTNLIEKNKLQVSYEEVKQISTRFFYDNGILCYQLLLRLKNNSETYLCQYSDFKKFQHSHHQILNEVYLNNPLSLSRFKKV